MKDRMRHALRKSKAQREVRAGKLYLQREIALRTSLSHEQAKEAMDAWGAIAWEVMLSGYRLRIGRVGHISLTVRRGMRHADGRAYPSIVIVGRCSHDLKRAWEDIHFEAWAEKREAEGYDVVETFRP